MKRTSIQMQFSLSISDPKTRAEIRTWNDKWTGDAFIDPSSVGAEHESSDDARQALVKKLRELADVIERDA